MDRLWESHRPPPASREHRLVCELVFGWLSKSRSHFSAPEFWDPIAESSRTIWGLPVNGAIISSTTICYAAKMATLELEFCERDDIVQSLCVSYHAGLVQEKLCCSVS